MSAKDGHSAQSTDIERLERENLELKNMVFILTMDLVHVLAICDVHNHLGEIHGD
jgi:hypothetical protein